MSGGCILAKVPFFKVSTHPTQPSTPSQPRPTPRYSRCSSRFCNPTGRCRQCREVPTPPLVPPARIANRRRTDIYARSNARRRQAHEHWE
eukprot:2722492-Pyramimonas_sp.AAC.1